jgi:MT0933-like antitoxin protein
MMKNLKQTALILLMAATLGTGLTACEKKGPAEKAGEHIDNALDKAGDKVDQAADKVDHAVDEAKK